MTERPLAIDLYCGLGGWTEGLLVEGYDVIGFDIERHAYGDHRYPAQLVLQDVRTIHGSQLKDASLIVASSPCQESSYRAMPWKRAKALGPPLLGMELFAQAERIQCEAIEAAGRFIPMIQENVRGAQKYVGRARWHYGSFYLWGDVPALMPITSARQADKIESPHLWLRDPKRAGGKYAPNYTKTEDDATKNDGGSWFNVAHNTTSGKGRNPDGRKNGGDWFSSGEGMSLQRHASSKSSARKAASARIAKIPLPLARHIARAYYPKHTAALASTIGATTARLGIPMAPGTEQQRGGE